MGKCFGISTDIHQPEDIEDIEMSIQNKEEREDSIESLSLKTIEQIENDANELLEEWLQDDVEETTDEILNKGEFKQLFEDEEQKRVEQWAEEFKQLAEDNEQKRMEQWADEILENN